jgi:hypothetical protein
LIGRISGVFEIVGAFVGCELVEAVGDGLPEIFDGPGGGLAQEGLELSEGLLDGVEVGRVGRQLEHEDDSKFWLDSNGALALDAEMQDKHRDLELTGVNGNWWIGLSVLHTLFAREHNAIVDRLKVDHPDKSGEWLFQKARLVNAALLAKIHTVEWTPALMDSAKGRMLMRGNYWGLKKELVRRAFGRLSDSEVVSGIPGSPQDHHSAPFAMTEEFTAAYRLHSLLPDEFSFRSHRDEEPLSTRDPPAGWPRGLIRAVSGLKRPTDQLNNRRKSVPGCCAMTAATRLSPPQSSSRV